MAIDLGPPRDMDEATRFFRLACASLLVPLALAEDWRDREGIETLRVARVNGELAGGLTVQRLGQWFGGRSVRCGVVRAVAVAPEHRGARVADAFLKATLGELRVEGYPIAMLFPATQIIYRRVGFEQAGAWVDWSIPIGELPSRDRGLTVTRVGLDSPVLRAVYARFAQRTAGLLDRNEWAWRRVGDPATPLELSAYVLGPSDAPEGYLIVHTERGLDGRQGALRVRDRAFLTARAYARARSFLAEHRSVTDRVCLSGGLVEPLFLSLDNQRQHILRREDWMLRLVDVPAALRARGYPRGFDAEVHLAVHDDVVTPHEQRWVLRLRDGVVELGEGGTGAVAIDVRGLAALYTGHLAADELVPLGYLGGDLSAAQTLTAVFAGPRPWMTEIV